MAMACIGGVLIDALQLGEAVFLEVEAGERHETVLDNAAFTPLQPLREMRRTRQVTSPYPPP